MATEQRYVASKPRADVGERASPIRDAAVWVELAIDRREDESCPISGLSNTQASGRVQLTGTTCHTIISHGDPEGADDGDGEVSIHTGTVEEGCTCSTVCGPGFTPVGLLVEEGSLVVRAYVDSRERLTGVIETLREGDDEWRLRRLTTPDGALSGDGGMPPALVEDLAVTEKQEEAVRAAVEMGYYSRPRDASLGDLASRLGVSRSALSQRLTAVESKLVESLAAEL